jgi:hypothetical protein
MNLKSLIRTLTAGFVLTLLMCFNPAVAQDTIGKVLMIQGKVLAYTDMGDQRVLRNNAAIYEGDTIETIGEGAVVVTLADGTQWDILDQSKVSILEYVYTPGGSGSQASAKYQIHEGLVTYTSGIMGQRGADIAIQMDDNTIYPEGTIISFMKRQNVSVFNTRQGSTRVVTKTRQTLKVKVGEWAVSGAGQTQVARSSGEAVTLIQNVFTRTGVTTTASGDVRIVAKTIVQTVVKVGNKVVSRTKTVTKNIIKMDQMIADDVDVDSSADSGADSSVGSGGSGHPVGYIPASTSVSNLFTLIDIITGGSTGQTYIINPNTGGSTLVPVSPN